MFCREERERRKEEKEEERRRRQQEKEAEVAARLQQQQLELAAADNFTSMMVEIDDVCMDDVEGDDEADEDEDEEEEEEDEDYAFPIGPLPQTVTNDLKSLDEMVRRFFLLPYQCLFAHCMK